MIRSKQVINNKLTLFPVLYFDLTVNILYNQFSLHVWKLCPFIIQRVIVIINSSSLSHFPSPDDQEWTGGGREGVAEDEPGVGEAEEGRQGGGAEEEVPGGGGEEAQDGAEAEVQAGGD